MINVKIQKGLITRSIPNPLYFQILITSAVSGATRTDPTAYGGIMGQERARGKRNGPANYEGPMRDILPAAPRNGTIGVTTSDAKENKTSALQHDRVVLYGQFMGAAAILCAVHRHGVEPAAVILEAVFDDMLETVKNRFRAMKVPSFPSAQLLVFWGGRQLGFNAFEYSPVAYAGSVRCPILFMHGRHDPRARIGEARRVYDAVPGRKLFKEFSEAGHEGYIGRFPSEWRRTVAEFLVDLSDSR